MTPGTAFLTLRSDGIDKYAQADGRFVGKPGTPTGVTVGRSRAEGRDQSRARRGRSSRDRISSARVPRDLQIHRRPRAGADRDRAGSGGQIERARDGHARRRSDQSSGGGRDRSKCIASPPTPANASAAPIHTSQTGADGRWGPAQVDPSWYLEIVLTSPGSTTTHFYRSPFPRSSDIVHLRAARAARSRPMRAPAPSS